MIRPTSTFLLAALVAGSPALARADSERSLPEVAERARSFQTLSGALRLAGLTETLAAGGPYTVFAPTDEAFAALPPEKLRALLEDPAGLRRLLLNHVAKGQVSAQEAADFDAVQTLGGSKLKIEAGSEGLRLGGAKVIQADIWARNGVIHAIDRVLWPAPAPEPVSIAAVAEQAGVFKTLLAAAKAAGLAEALAGADPLTVFAPTDEAFSVLPSGALEALLADRDRLRRLLLHHVVAGGLRAGDAAARAGLRTLAGTRLRVRAEEGQLRVAGAQITRADLEAGAGVIHVVDRVLLPPPATPSQSSLRFPAYEGRNLAGEPYRLPGGLAGELNLVLIPFLQWQQSEVDTWLRWLADSPLASRAGFAWWELPTLEDRGPTFRNFLDRGMAAGIPDPAARARTITIYTDVSAFCEALEIPSVRAIQVLLLDREGRVLWRSSGAYAPSKGAELSQALERLRGASK